MYQRILIVALVVVLLIAGLLAQGPLASLALGPAQATTPASLLLRAETAMLQPGRQTQLTATVRDAQGRPVAGATVAFSANSGSVAPAQAVTGADGVAMATFSGGATGLSTITAEAGAARGQTLIQVTAASSGRSHLTLEISATSLAPGQQVAVTVRATGADGQALAGEEITLFAALGELRPASVLTGEDGRATARFTAAQSGEARVVALAGELSAVQTLTISGSQNANRAMYLPLVARR